MTWPPKQRTHTDASWTVQIQYEHGGWWSNLMADLSRGDADALMAERQEANPHRRFRLVRVMTTYTVEPVAKRQDGAQPS